jgi:hypothetical protein
MAAFNFKGIARMGRRSTSGKQYAFIFMEITQFLLTGSGPTKVGGLNSNRALML